MARVLLFGALADIAGWREREAGDATLSGLRARLADEQPELGRALARPGVQVALDRTLHRGDAALAAGAEVAFLPAMSGAEVTVRLQTAPLDPGALLGGFCAGRRETGAVVSFTGLMRAEAGGALALELEAYPGFTEAEIARVQAEATARFGLDDSLVAHRYGRIAPGEAIVFVATAAAHRRAAFDAADRLMDYLKSQAPLWKCSLGPQGARWVEPSPQDLADAARWDAATPRAAAQVGAGE